MSNIDLDRRPTDAELKEHGAVGEAWQTGTRLILVVSPRAPDPLF
jgi:hypothetical protein